MFFHTLDPHIGHLSLFGIFIYSSVCFPSSIPLSVIFNCFHSIIPRAQISTYIIFSMMIYTSQIAWIGIIAIMTIDMSVFSCHSKWDKVTAYFTLNIIRFFIRFHLIPRLSALERRISLTAIPANPDPPPPVAIRLARNNHPRLSTPAFRTSDPFVIAFHDVIIRPFLAPVQHISPP